MTEDKETTKEQILGLYIVGLLAVLVAFKLSNQLDPTADGLFMMVIALWGTYSFCMVFAYSNISRIFESSTSKSTYERFANFSKDFAQCTLLVSFGASIILFVWYAWPMLLFMLIMFVIILPIYYSARVLRKRLGKK